MKRLQRANSKKLISISPVVKRKIKKEIEEKEKSWQYYIKINTEVVILNKTSYHTGNIGDTGIVVNINTVSANINNRIYAVKLDSNQGIYSLEYGVDFILSKDYKGEIAKKKSPEHIAIDRFFNNMTYSGSTNSCGVKELNNVHVAWTSYLQPALCSTESKQIIYEYLKNNFVFRVREKSGACAHIMISMPQQYNQDAINFLDSIASLKSDWKRNPNSSNMIRVWIIN